MQKIEKVLHYYSPHKEGAKFCVLCGSPLVEVFDGRTTFDHITGE
jgi:hypothetical protein